MSIWPSPRRWFSKPRGEQSKTLHPKPSLFSSLSRDRPAGTRRQNASNRRHRRGGYWRTGGLDVSAGAIGKTFEKRWQGRGMGVVNSGQCRRQHRSCQGRFRVATKGSPLYASCCSYVGLRRIVALVEQRLAAQGTQVHRRSNRRSSARLDAGLCSGAMRARQRRSRRRPCATTGPARCARLAETGLEDHRATSSTVAAEIRRIGSSAMRLEGRCFRFGSTFPS